MRKENDKTHLSLASSNPHLVRTPPTCGTLRVIFQDKSPQANDEDEPPAQDRAAPQQPHNAQRDPAAIEAAYEKLHAALQAENDFTTALAATRIKEFVELEGPALLRTVNTSPRPTPSFERVMTLALQDGCYTGGAPAHEVNPQTLYTTFEDLLSPLQQYGHALFQDGKIPPHVIHATILADVSDIHRGDVPDKAYLIRRKANRILNNDGRGIAQASPHVKAVVYTLLMSKIDDHIHETNKQIAINKEEASQPHTPETATDQDIEQSYRFLRSLAEELYNQRPDLMQEFKLTSVDMLYRYMVEAVCEKTPDLLPSLDENDTYLIFELTTNYCIQKNRIPEIQDQAAATNIAPLFNAPDEDRSLAFTLNNIPCTNEFEQALHERAAELHWRLALDNGADIKNDLASVIHIPQHTLARVNNPS